MKFAQRFLWLTCLSILNFAGVPAAADFSDMDADVEETMFESEASSRQAQMMETRLKRDRIETQKAQQKAQSFKAQVLAKQKAADMKIKDTDQKIQKLQADQLIARQQIKKSGEEIAVMEANLKKSQGKLNSTLRDQQTLLQMKREMLAKKAQLSAQLNKVRNDQVRAQRHTVVAEAEMRKIRSDLKKLEADVQNAEAEKQQADSRLRDAKERLLALREEAKTREAQMLARKTSAEDFVQARASRDIIMQLEQRKYERAVERTPASQRPLEVALIPTAIAHGKAPRKVLIRDCQVFDQPNRSAKVMGLKRAGSTLAYSKTNKDWFSVHMANKTMFVKSTCL